MVVPVNCWRLTPQRMNENGRAIAKGIVSSPPPMLGMLCQATRKNVAGPTFVGARTSVLRPPMRGVPMQVRSPADREELLRGDPRPFRRQVRVGHEHPVIERLVVARAQETAIDLNAHHAQGKLVDDLDPNRIRPSVCEWLLIDRGIRRVPAWIASLDGEQRRLCWVAGSEEHGDGVDVHVARRRWGKIGRAHVGTVL